MLTLHSSHLFPKKFRGKRMIITCILEISWGSERLWFPEWGHTAYKWPSLGFNPHLSGSVVWVLRVYRFNSTAGAWRLPGRAHFLTPTTVSGAATWSLSFTRSGMDQLQRADRRGMEGVLDPWGPERAHRGLCSWGEGGGMGKENGVQLCCLVETRLQQFFSLYCPRTITTEAFL